MKGLFDWLRKDEPQVPPPAPPAAMDDEGELVDRIIAALKTIYDPEIPVNIYDLGLVYEIGYTDAGAILVKMTLTAPGCPVAQTFPGTVEEILRGVEGVADAHVELVWDPPWSKERMSEAARLELGML